MIITRKSTIEQHVGEHLGTGIRIMKPRDVVTELEFKDDEPAAALDEIADDVHGARVQLAGLDVERRRRAEAWLGDHAGEMAGQVNDEGVWIRRAIRAVS